MGCYCFDKCVNVFVWYCTIDYCSKKLSIVHCVGVNYVFETVHKLISRGCIVWAMEEVMQCIFIYRVANFTAAGKTIDEVVGEYMRVEGNEPYFVAVLAKYQFFCCIFCGSVRVFWKGVFSGCS